MIFSSTEMTMWFFWSDNSTNVVKIVVQGLQICCLGLWFGNGFLDMTSNTSHKKFLNFWWLWNENYELIYSEGQVGLVAVFHTKVSYKEIVHKKIHSLNDYNNFKHAALVFKSLIYVIYYLTFQIIQKLYPIPNP